METTTGYCNADVYLTKSAESLNTITSPQIKNPIEFTFFVSCYNEENFIIDTLNEVIRAMATLKKSYEIIIIDDGSTDSSVEIVRKFIEENSNVNIMLRVNKTNKGLSHNYVDGAFIGSGKYYRFICGDNAEPAETLITILSYAGEADIIIPYHTDVLGRSQFRKLVSKLYTFLINILSGNNIKYYNGLHLHLRQNVMRWHANTRGFAFQAFLLCQLLEKGLSYKQVACVAYNRRLKKTNAFTWKNLRSVIHVMLSIFIRRIFA